MNTAAILPVLAFALASVGPAQTCRHYPSDTPTVGAPDPRPFGAQDPLDPTYGTMRYHMQIPTSVLGNQPLDICEIFVVPAGNRTREFADLSMRLGHNPNPITGTFAFNMVGFSAVRVGTQSSSFDTVADQWMPLGMEGPFRYDPANGMLVIEFFVQRSGAPNGTGDAGFRTDPSIPFVWRTGPSYNNGNMEAGGGIKLRFCTDHHGFIEYGSGGCVGSQGSVPRLTYGGSAQIGSTLQINLANGHVAPGTLSVLVFSYRVRSGPFDLGGFGAPGCEAFVFGNDATWLATSTGALTHTINLPLGLTPCFPVWNQWFQFDPAANGLGVITSNYGRIMIGN